MSYITLRIREKAVAAVDAGERIRAVAARFGMHPGTLDALLDRRVRTGSLRARLPNTMTEEQRAMLRELRLADPAATYNVLVERLAEKSGVRFAQTKIGSEIRKMGFVRVKAPKPRRMTPEAPTGAPGGYRTPAVGHDRKRYPSDLSDAQWALLEPLIPPSKPGGRPQKHDRRSIVNAILYVSRTGCQWRALPHDFPPWSTVYDLFRQWRDTGVWARANATLRERLRVTYGREPTPSAAIIDSQVAKATEKGGSVATTAASGSAGANATSW